MTPAELKTLRSNILSLPPGSPVRLAFVDGRDADCADLLNDPVRPGFVPRRHLAVTFARHPAVYGLARWAVQFGTLPADYGGGPVPFGRFSLFSAVLLVVDSDAGLMASAAELEAGLASIPVSMVPEPFRSDLLAGEVKIGLAAEWLGRAVSAVDVADARRVE